jgi:hypothetical protein
MGCRLFVSLGHGQPAGSTVVIERSAVQVEFRIASQCLECCAASSFETDGSEQKHRLEFCT